MNARRPWNLFAIVDNPEATIQRIPLSQDVQTAISGLFQAQFEALFAGEPEEVPFDARLTPDSSEIFYLPNFDPPKPLWDALENPTTLDVFQATDETLAKTKGIFTGDFGERQIYLQVFDRRQALSAKGFTLIFTKTTFRRLEDPGLMLDNQLAAAFSQEKLFFRSFYVARRLFDLSKYFQEATNEELESFARHQTVTVPEPDMFLKNADSWVRKNISLIMKSGLLDSQPPAKIAQVAQDYKLSLQFAQDGKLVIPSKKSELKKVLQLLAENFFTSDLTGQQFVSNSKRRL